MKINENWWESKKKLIKNFRDTKVVQNFLTDFLNYLRQENFIKKVPLKNGTDKFKDFFSSKPFLYGYVINYFEEGAGDKFILEFKNNI